MTLKSLPRFGGLGILAQHLNIKEFDPNDTRFSFNKHTVRVKTI